MSAFASECFLLPVLVFVLVFMRRLRAIIPPKGGTFPALSHRRYYINRITAPHWSRLQPSIRWKGNQVLQRSTRHSPRNPKPGHQLHERCKLLAWPRGSRGGGGVGGGGVGGVEAGNRDFCRKLTASAGAEATCEYYYSSYH